MHHTLCIYCKTLYQAGKQPPQRTKQNYNMEPAPISLRLEVLAQAREVLSLKRALRLGESSSSGTVASVISRLGETTHLSEITHGSKRKLVA